MFTTQVTSKPRVDQIPLDGVENHRTHHVTDVRSIVHGGTAQVDSDFARLDRLKLFFGASQRVVNAKSHVIHHLLRIANCNGVGQRHSVGSGNGLFGNACRERQCLETAMSGIGLSGTECPETKSAIQAALYVRQLGPDVTGCHTVSAQQDDALGRNGFLLDRRDPPASPVFALSPTASAAISRISAMRWQIRPFVGLNLGRWAKTMQSRFCTW